MMLLNTFIRLSTSTLPSKNLIINLGINLTVENNKIKAMSYSMLMYSKG
jgi:hypothetical protein